MATPKIFLKLRAYCTYFHGKETKFIFSFLGRIYGAPICLRVYLTFSNSHLSFFFAFLVDLGFFQFQWLNPQFSTLVWLCHSNASAAGVLLKLINTSCKRGQKLQNGWPYIFFGAMSSTQKYLLFAIYEHVFFLFPISKFSN